jgi:imidazolonepropionase-like amidohydrolase
MQGMKFPGAPYTLKMACGENPKRVYGKKGKLPSTPMGSVYAYRKAWLDAAEYARKWDSFRAKRDANDDKAEAPKRDLLLDTLVGVLRGEILIQNHCYGGYEMATMLDIAHEFGFRIAAFHHAVEAYKVAPLLAKENVCAAVWAERGAMKMEAYDVSDANAVILRQNKACVIIHSDDGMLIQHLPQEAALAMSAGLRAGIEIPRAEAIAWVTANPAKALGIGDRVGTLEPGKMADVVVWSGDPFSVYTLAEQTYVDGALVYDRRDRKRQPKSDFELGQPGEGEFHP